jgi:hypothetical protein
MILLGFYVLLHDWTLRAANIANEECMRLGDLGANWTTPYVASSNHNARIVCLKLFAQPELTALFTLVQSRRGLQAVQVLVQSRNMALFAYMNSKCNNRSFRPLFPN